jgi:hypothetical protein
MLLFDSEIRRALARRAVRVLVLLALLGIAVSAVITFFVSKPNFDRAAALRKASIERQAQVATCVRSNDVPQSDSGQTPAELCDQFLPGPGAFVQDKRFHMERLWSKRDPLLGGLSPLLLIGALIGGATMFGAEWRHGTIGTLLTWEPRRWRVFAAKVFAVVLCTFVISVLLQAVLVLALTPAAVWRGTTAGLTAAWWRGLAGGVLRISAMSAAVAVLGATIASVGRNTAAGIGVALGYSVVGENVLRALRPKWQPWLLTNNGVTFVIGHRINLPHAKSFLGATVILLVYMALLVGVAGASFVRRDVT